MSILVSLLFGGVIGFVIAAYFYGRSTRDLKATEWNLSTESTSLRAEVASLKEQMSTLLSTLISTLPMRIVEVLVERGQIERNREPEARTAVEQLLRSWPVGRSTSLPITIGAILAGGDELPKGFQFGPPDVSDEKKEPRR